MLTEGALVQSIVNGYINSPEILRRAGQVDPNHFDAAVQVFAYGNFTLMTPAAEAQVDQLLHMFNTRVSESLQRIEVASGIKALALQT